MALYLGDPEKKHCFQIKGTVTVKTSGPDYEKIKAQIKEKGPHYPAKGLLILKITEVFDCTPGPNAGKKSHNFLGIVLFLPLIFVGLFNHTSRSGHSRGAAPSACPRRCGNLKTCERLPESCWNARTSALINNNCFSVFFSLLFFLFLRLDAFVYWRFN
ncbi:MAG: hypothetical protein ABSB80_06075 [Methanoregula sp.]|jgi:hypothetical protein|uniref:hypothetical protein n=1 Tax=Methanoregula sp. TaxID=2052170 RepID=UPI003D09AE48